MISARFIVTMGHLTALLILFATIDSNVEVSLADNSSSSDKQRARESAIVSHSIFNRSDPVTEKHFPCF